MILDKLKETLAQVAVERRALDETERQLRSMIANLTGGVTVADPDSVGLSNLGSFQLMSAEKTDGIGEIVAILRANGRPMHITEIAEKLGRVRGKKVDRTEIEPGLNRHIQKTKKRRIDKFGPSTFGLPEWKNRPELVHVAS